MSGYKFNYHQQENGDIKQEEKYFSALDEEDIIKLSLLNSDDTTNSYYTECTSPHPDTRKLGSTNHKPPSYLDRETSSLSTLFVLSAISIHLELIRQVCSYAIKYKNQDVYPMPSTLLVFCVELSKFTFFFVKLLASGKLHGINISFCYVLPSTLYALNNNIYFLALHYTTPPVWNILMQSRVIVTAVIYKFHFKKVITTIQWAGLITLTSAIIVLQFSGRDGVFMAGGRSSSILVALGLAALASVFAAVGPVYTEYLLKHDKRTFDDKQLQMYVFGMLITGTMFLAERYATADELTPILVINGDMGVLLGLLFSCVACTVMSGIVVALIIKKLDNIVKLYTQAISNAMTALACFMFFPRTFQFDIVFIISLLMTVVSIYLYEAKALPCRPNTRSSVVDG